MHWRASQPSGCSINHRRASSRPLLGRPHFFDATGRVVEARRTSVDVLSDTSYAWIGNLHAQREDTGREGRVGSIILVQEKSGRVTGSIRLGADHFKLRALGDAGLHVLVDVDESKIPSPGAPPSRGSQQRQEGEPDTTSRSRLQSAKTLQAQSLQPSSHSQVTTCEVRQHELLVVYTSEAANGRNPSSVAATAVTEANVSYSNSSVGDLDLILAHTEEVGITESTDVSAEQRILDDLSSLKNSTEVSTLRSQYEADLVVLLTAGDYVDQYGQILGVADVINAQLPSEAFVVVDIDFATSGSYTLTHEVGHLQGGQHHPLDSAPSPRGFDYGFGHRFEDWDWDDPLSKDHYATIMAYSTGAHLDNDYTNIEYFSNPVVIFDSEATGIADERDNARALRTTTARLADFLVPHELRAFFYAAYGDPQTGAYTFEANPCGGTGSYSYEWYVSQDPYSQGPLVGTGSTLSTTLASGANYVTLTVHSGDGQTASVTNFFDVSGEGEGTNSLASKTNPRDHLGQPREFALYGTSPNPVEQRAYIEYDVPETTDVTLEVYDMLGRLVQRVVKDQRTPGRHRVSFSSAHLSSGTYLLRMTAGPFANTKKFTVVE